MNLPGFRKLPTADAIINAVQDAVAALAQQLIAALNEHDYQIGLRATIAQEEWHEVGALGEPAFLNSWADYGGGEATAAYYRDTIGEVHLKGTVHSGTIGAQIFTLPSGYRPEAGRAFATQANLLHAVAYVAADGSVYALTGSNVSSFALDCVSFRAA